MTGNKKRSRLRLIRRRDRVRKGLPLRSDAGQPRAPRRFDAVEREEPDLDTPDADLIGVTE
jgi:hypothetical protein